MNSRCNGFFPSYLARPNILIYPFALFFLLFSVWGCAGTISEVRSQVQFIDSSLSKAVTRLPDSSRPTEESNVFSSDDKQAVMWVKLRDIEGVHRLRWEWYDPMGRLYYNTRNYRINTDGRLRHFNTSWHKIGLRGEKAGNMPGSWTVKVYLDDDMIVTKKFELTKISDLHRFIMSGPGFNITPDRHKWGVVIGIENYRKSVEARFAKNDAVLVKNYLMKFIGVPKENLITLINETATKAEVEVLVKDKLRGLIRPGDTLYFYYAGHGIPSDGAPYMLPYDGDIDNPGITAYAINDLYKDLQEIPAKEILVFLDTCFSGRVGRAAGEKLLFADARPGFLRVDNPVLVSNKMVVITASKASQLSNSYRSKKHGLFTYYLLRGLVGDADINGDNRVELGELSRYVREEVNVASRRLFGMSRQQDPQVSPESLGDREDKVISVVSTNN